MELYANACCNSFEFYSVAANKKRHFYSVAANKNKKYYPKVTYLWVIFCIFADRYQKQFQNMTAYQSPFQFGTLATEENFIDRVEEVSSTSHHKP